jgi:hypothetical protein
MTVEYLRGYRLLRQDPGFWQKLLVGSLILFSGVAVPLIGQVVLQGWQSIIVRRIALGHDGGPLPRLDWDFNYLGKLLMEGFKPLIVSILWSLPAVIVALPFLVGGYLGLLFGVVATAEDSGDASGPLTLAGSVASMFVGSLLMLLLLVPARVAALRAELAGDLNEGLKFGEVMRFTRQNLGTLIKGELVLALVGAVLGMIGLACCYVGVFAVAFAGFVAQGVFIAQVYRAHVARGGEPFPTKEVPVDALA